MQLPVPAAEALIASMSLHLRHSVPDLLHWMHREVDWPCKAWMNAAEGKAPLNRGELKYWNNEWVCRSLGISLDPLAHFIEVRKQRHTNTVPRVPRWGE